MHCTRNETIYESQMLPKVHLNLRNQSVQFAHNTTSRLIIYPLQPGTRTRTTINTDTPRGKTTTTMPPWRRRSRRQRSRRKRRVQRENSLFIHFRIYRWQGRNRGGSRCIPRGPPRWKGRKGCVRARDLGQWKFEGTKRRTRFRVEIPENESGFLEGLVGLVNERLDGLRLGLGSSSGVLTGGGFSAPEDEECKDDEEYGSDGDCDVYRNEGAGV